MSGRGREESEARERTKKATMPWFEAVAHVLGRNTQVSVWLEGEACMMDSLLGSK